MVANWRIKSMAADRATPARGRAGRRLVAGPPSGREWHLAEADDRGSLARLALPLRTVADLQRSTSSADGEDTWDWQLANARTKSDAVGEVECPASIDNTIVRTYQAGPSRGISRGPRPRLR